MSATRTASTMRETDFASLPLVNYVEAALIVITFVVGFMVNFVSFLIIIRHKSFHNSFGYIIAYNALANVFVLLVIGAWAAPWTLFDVPKSVQGANLFFGQTALFFLEAGFHGNLLITVNRFAAVTFPLKYRLWFTRRSTIIMLICVTCLPLAYSTIFFIETCDFYYDHETRVWKFGVHYCSVFLATYIDLCYNILLFVIVAVIDSITLVRLQSMKKKSMARKVCTSLETEEINRQHRKEVNLFAQAFLTSVVYSLMLLCFNLTNWHVSEGFFLFLGTTFTWELSHALGGYIIIWFNPEIRRHLVSVQEFVSFFNRPSSKVNVLQLTSSRN